MNEHKSTLLNQSYGQFPSNSLQARQYRILRQHFYYNERIGGEGP